MYGWFDDRTKKGMNEGKGREMKEWRTHVEYVGSSAVVFPAGERSGVWSVFVILLLSWKCCVVIVVRLVTFFVIIFVVDVVFSLVVDFFVYVVSSDVDFLLFSLLLILLFVLLFHCERDKESFWKRFLWRLIRQAAASHSDNNETRKRHLLLIGWSRSGVWKSCSKNHLL